MIRIDVDMWQHGSPIDKYRLATVEIINDGILSQTNSKRGDYIVRAYSRDGKIIRTAAVKDWPRQSRPVLELLAEALKALGYEHRNK